MAISPISFSAHADRILTFKEFIKAIESYQDHKDLDDSTLERLRANVNGRAFYELNTYLRPGQTAISYFFSYLKYRKIKSLNSRGSAYFLKDAYPAILTSRGVILCDGHHHFLASYAAGGTHFPVQLVRDYSHMSFAKAIQQAKEDGLVFYEMPTGEDRVILEFSKLLNDPNRLLVGLIILKRYWKNGKIVRTSQRIDHPLIFKDIPGDKPFSELKTGNALYSVGFIYNEEKYEEDPSKKELVRIEEHLHEIVDRDLPYSDQIKFVNPAVACSTVLGK